MIGKTLRGILSAAIGLVMPLSAASAAEQPVALRPPGGTDFGQAILPDPGLYGVAVSIPNFYNTRTYDFQGNANPPNRTLKSQVNQGFLDFLYVYPIDLFGGRIATDIVIPFQAIDYKLAGKSGHGSTGLADVFINAFYWTKNLGLFGVTPGTLPLAYGLNFGAGLAVKPPTGDFSTRNIISLGSNTWTFVPNFAFTYITGPNWSIGDSTAISMRTSFGFSTENPLTRYQTGNIMNIDWAVSQRFGLFQVGISGTYQAQISDDVPLSGIRPLHGGRYSFLQMGPTIQYDIPQYKAFIKVKYILPVTDRSFNNNQYFLVAVGKKF